MSRELLEQALDFVGRVTHWQEGRPDRHDILVALRAALDAPQPEPVAWISEYGLQDLTCPEKLGSLEWEVKRRSEGLATIALYTAPPAAIPDGMCLVPIEATDAMVNAVMADNYVHGDLDAARIVLRDEYRAMIAAALSQPVQPTPRVPLTDEQICTIYAEWDATPGASYADLMRMVERAHGITGGRK